MFDTQERIKKDYFEYRNMKFSTSLPIFHLIIYMIECGLSVDEMVEDLKPQICSQSKAEIRTLCSEYMELTYPLYAIKNKREIEYFKYRANEFYISVIRKDDIITGIKVDFAGSWNNSIVEIDNLKIEETVRWCLDEFSLYINTAALWDKQKT